jgi:uncharacterized protein
MEEWIALNSLPPAGLSLTVDDPAVWAAPLREVALACTIRLPLKAEVFLLRQQGGCFVRGRLTGEVGVPCDRCAEECHTAIDQSFESFEPVPSLSPGPEAGPAGKEAGKDAGKEAGKDADKDRDEHVMRQGESGPEINVAALLWEEFSLSLPVHPLCRPDCAGLCPSCGKNLNGGACACDRDRGDPRLAVLRGLTMKKSPPALK